MARLEKLESEMAAMKADLGAARAGQAEAVASSQAAANAAASAAEAGRVAQSAVAANEATAKKLAALEAKPQAEGVRDGNTTLKLGGYLKMIAANTAFSDGSVATNSLGRDFYLPQAVPTGGGKSSRAQDFTAKQSRLWVNLESTVAGHKVKGYLETDFQTTANAAPAIAGGGSQRTTNGYTLALRRAYVQLDRWTFGQDWTTFQYTGALPESTDYVGGAEGTVFVRQPQIRYSAPLGKGLTLNVAIENPESGTANAGSATLTENGTDHIPDFTARLAYAGTIGELSLAALGRQVRVENAGVGSTASGFGVNAAGKLWLAADKGSDLRFMATYGQNISRYVGLNFAPDAVYVPATGQLADVKVFAALLAARVAIAPGVRANLMGSYQHVAYDGSLSLATISAYNKQAWSLAGNVFYSPVKNIDLGVEYRHGERELVGGASGKIDRVEFAAKYSF